MGALQKTSGDQEMQDCSFNVCLPVLDEGPRQQETGRDVLKGNAHTVSVLSAF